MKQTESARDFHHRLIQDNSEPGQFTIYKTEDRQGYTPLPHTRRDFYKISLVTRAEGILSYADKSFHIRGNVIAFFNPMIPYSWEPISQDDSGYSCLFTEDFIGHHLHSDSLSKSPLFKVSGNHVLVPDQKSMTFLNGIFEQMITEMRSNYVYKYDLLRSYIPIIIHEALKIEPLEKKQQPGSSSARISALFLDLLERQFPIASPQHAVRLKNANEFASQLPVHTNHLNRALKETTGKTTTEHIADRLLKEAKALLLHSNWDIAEIGYCLGFEHASNFNIFFKKQTGQTPNHFRKEAAIS
ncbi:helix-turn-helix domain-containing protein [Spirosoma sp. HMF4905]|uniref:Helix-turn-helix domain-containing protein n=1 Tax=Spirosoma arboris TaxID=2682092 RepID=A0A7K1SNL7_9BACT|nr:helix-turn-helix domain-containing protein [Spirosoma arboris]MVM35395.1 helix-turn-helix domain-containing protein [Spirosoma arboris]